MSRALGWVLAVAAGLAMPGGALTHHSVDALFDRSRSLEFDAVLDSFDMINPHVWFHFYAYAADGSFKEWSIEGGAPTQIRRSIIEQYGSLEFETGKKYTVTIWPSRANEADGYLRSLKFPDGTVFTCC